MGKSAKIAVFALFRYSAASADLFKSQERVFSQGIFLMISLHLTTGSFT